MQLTFSMKVLLTIFAIFVVIVYCHDGHRHEVDEIRAPNSDVEDCAQKYKIDRMLFAELKRNKTYMATPDTQCFAACILRKSGIMLADGTINRDFVESQIANECKNRFFAFGKEECEIAAKILACLTQKNIIVFSKD